MPVRIQWTPAEEAMLIDWLADAGLSGASNGLTRMVKQAQAELLPPERRRPIKSIWNITADFKARLTEAHHQRLREAQERISGAGPAEPASAPEPPPSAAQAPALGVLERLIGSLESLDESLRAALDVLAARDEHIAKLQVSEQLRAQRAAQNVTKRKPRIVVVGANPDQQRAIEQAHAQHFDLITFPNWAPNLKEQLRHADAVVSMTKFLSHQTENIIKANKRGEYLRCNGGASDVVQSLHLLRQRLISATV